MQSSKRNSTKLTLAVPLHLEVELRADQALELDHELEPVVPQ